MVRPLLPLAAALVILCAGCGFELRARQPAAVDTSVAPVGLVTDGSAFERPGVRDAVVLAVRDAARRPVVLIDSAVSLDETRTRVAAAATKSDRAVAKYDWREPHCAADAIVLLALQNDVDAVYRVSLDYRAGLRAPTDDEAAALKRRAQPLRVVQGALRLARRDTVAEESVSGTVVLSSFAAGVESRRVPVSQTLARVEPTPFGDHLDIGAAVTKALASLPAAPAPAWDAVARRLTSSGCPLLALAVYEDRVRATRSHPELKAAALKAMRRNVDRRSAKQLGDTAQAKLKAAVERGDLDEAAQIVARYSADPAANADTARKLTQTLNSVRAARTGNGGPPEVEEKYSCRALCGMHMVEICNNDKALWSSNRSNWEATPCGRRRDEGFLRDCYRQQWLNGAFESACLVPCEGSPEGRNRLLSILQDAGCTRTRLF